MRVIKFAVGINIVAFVIMYFGFYVRNINSNASFAIIFLTLIFGFVANAFFCIPNRRLIGEGKKYFYLKYNNEPQKNPLNFKEFAAIDYSSYSFNILIAVCLVSIPYGFLCNDFLLTKIMLIGGLCWGTLLIVFVRYLRPYAKFSKGEERLLSKTLAWPDGNVYQSREFLVSFFDITFWFIVILFWLLVGAFLFSL